jgi:hypothetical protein
MIGRLALGGLRVVVLVHAAMVLAQAAFAGRFLAGDAAGLRAHETNAGLIELVALLQLVLAVAVWRPGRGPGWPAVASLALLLAEGFQIGMGYEGRLAVHVPLGVAIFGLTVALAVGSWRLALPAGAGSGRGASQPGKAPERA